MSQLDMPTRAQEESESVNILPKIVLVPGRTAPGGARSSSTCRPTAIMSPPLSFR